MLSFDSGRIAEISIRKNTYAYISKFIILNFRHKSEATIKNRSGQMRIQPQDYEICFSKSPDLRPVSNKANVYTSRNRLICKIGECLNDYGNPA